MSEEKKQILQKYKEELKEAWHDLKTPGQRHKQVPNVLTVLRMLSPFFIIPSVIIGNIPLFVGLTVAFSLSDLADGLIARKFNLASDLGRDLDAVCDKIFAITLLLSATFMNPLLLGNVLLEGVISAINIHKKLNGQEPKSSMIGKIKTWSLFTLAGLGMLSKYFSIAGLVDTLLVTTIGMQALTIGSYLKDNHNDSKNGSIQQDVIIESEIEKEDDDKEKVLNLQLQKSEESEVYQNNEEEIIKEKGKVKQKTLKYK